MRAVRSRLLGLPPLRLPPLGTGHTVHRGVRVPMRDGVELLADHYAPDTETPAGTLLVRGPYGRGAPFSTLFGSFYAAHGYHVLLQSVRGTFGSGGEFTPMVHEVADGADTAAWLCEQPWFTGSFATIGLSYLGFTQWALLTDPPPQCAAAVVLVGPHDFWASSWGTGAFTLNDFLGWSHLMAHQEDPRRLRALLRQLMSRRAVARAADGVPLGAAGRALLGTGARWYESWLEHPDPDDPFWAPMRLTRALDRMDRPVLLIGGWQDLFLDQTLQQYTRLRDRGVPVAMTIGPWTHGHILTRAAPRVLRESLAWLDTRLAGTRTASRPPVRVHVRRRGWYDLPDWPPELPAQSWYLRPGRHPRTEACLGTTAPDTGAAAPGWSFTFDPADPTPTVGGRLLSPAGGRRRDDRLARRPDVLSFTSQPLPHALRLLGVPVAELVHSCDNPHHDLFVRISEVDRRGRSVNVSDGFRRCHREAGSIGTVRLELDAVGHTFRAGHRIRVLIAGGSHPRFTRNLGTGEPPVSGRRMTPATHTVHPGTRVLLPADTEPPDPGSGFPSGH